MQEGSTSLFGQHLKLPTLPSSSLTLTFSDAKKNKSFPGSKVSVDLTFVDFIALLLKTCLPMFGKRVKISSSLFPFSPNPKLKDAGGIELQ